MSRPGAGDDPAPRDRAHLPALDELRGLAALLVVLFHSAQFRPAGAAEQVLAKLVGFGWTGVDLFFVLSGFLITGILLDARSSPDRMRNFYARRALRILPLYYGALVVAFLVVPQLLPGSPLLGGGGAPQRELLYWLYVHNWRVAIAGDWCPPEMLNHLWSLHIEEQFYLAWPLLVFGFGHRVTMRTCGVLLLASLGLRAALALHDVPWLASYVLTPARLDGLCVGGWLACRARAPGGLGGVARWLLPVAVGGAVYVAGSVAVLGGFRSEDPLTLTLGMAVVALLYGTLVAAAALSPPTARSGRGRSSLRFLGRYSYAVYVVHWPVLLLLTPTLGAPDSWIVLGSDLPRALACFAATLAISLGLALVSWHVLEAPFLGLKRHFPSGSPGAATTGTTARAGVPASGSERRGG